MLRGGSAEIGTVRWSLARVIRRLMLSGSSSGAAGELFLGDGSYHCERLAERIGA
jgi:hypothetical protein